MLKDQSPRWSCSRGADGSWCPRGGPVCPGSRWRTAPWRDGCPDPTAHLCDPETQVFKTPETAVCMSLLAPSITNQIMCTCYTRNVHILCVCTCTIGVNVSGNAALMMAFLVVPMKSSPGLPSARARMGPNDSPTWTHTQYTLKERSDVPVKASHTHSR